MKKGNFYLSDKFADQMTDAISDGKCKVTIKKDLPISCLREQAELRSCIKNKGLLGTLSKLGVKYTQVKDNTILPVAGDVLFVVYPTYKQQDLWPYKEDKCLPNDIHLSVKKYTFGEE